MMAGPAASFGPGRPRPVTPPMPPPSPTRLFSTMAGALVLVAIIGWQARDTHPQSAPRDVAQARMIDFLDRPDGAIVIRDATNGREIARIAPQQGGFVRGVMRAVAAMRRRHRVPLEGPVRVERAADGRLGLFDPADREWTGLDGFGPTNVASFASLLGDAGQGS